MHAVSCADSIGLTAGEYAKSGVMASGQGAHENQHVFTTDADF